MSDNKKPITKISLNVPNELLSWIDNTASEMGMNRSSFIMLTIHDYKKQHLAVNGMVGYSALYEEFKKQQQVADTECD